MQYRSKTETRRSLLLCLFVLGLVTGLTILASQFRSEAGGQKGLFQRTTSHDPALPDFDIRTDKTEQSSDALVDFRQKSGKDASAVATVRDEFVRGEDALRSSVPSLKIEYNQDIRIPELITPDVWKTKMEYLTAPSTAKRSDILRNFIKDNGNLIGVHGQQADSLKVTADYTNPDGNLSYARLEQLINGYPVFRGEVNAGFTRSGQMIRVINNLAPGLDYESLSTDFHNPADAVRAAAGLINHQLKPEETTRNAAESTNLKSVFGSGDWATTAEAMYFPTEPGVARTAWRVLIWEPVNAYYVIVDAETGAMLWRKNITNDQTTPATYNVYANAPSYINTADHAAPLSPYISVPPNDPTVGAQGALITRTNVTLIGNEGPLSFNNNGWITDGTNLTDGNATEAGVDRVAPNGPDIPLPTGDGTCPGVGCRVFSSPTWNPPPGSPAPGDDPLTPQAQRGAVIQMFYIMNRYHDELYLRGFTEPARNFQQDNFGRNPGGATANAIAGLDRVSSEGQDSGGFNNANFGTPADGGRGRMQMYLWNGPTPDRDGTADADIVIHEVSHGLSHRIHGNGSGLGNQGGMMGEGWGDWYAHTMLSDAAQDANGIYALGGYSLYQLGGFTSNYYHGIRRFPTALIASTGGPMNKPHNPLTFGHLNAGCDTTLGTTGTAVASAFPRNPVIATSANCSQVHNAGEIWKSALWEVRSLMVARLGFAAGTTRVLQVVTDGMKLSPISPTFLQERDGIIAAAAALSASASPELAADVVDVREGMRRRGMGFSASVQSNTAVTEAFDTPNVVITDPFTVSDAAPGGDNDGFPEPGETVVLSVPVTNTTGATITNVMVTLVGGATQNYGDIANGATVVRTFNYLIPAGAVCGSLHTVTFNLTSSGGTTNGITRSFRLGKPNGAFNSTPIAINDNLPATPYPSNITVSGITGTVAVRVAISGFSHTFPNDVDMLLVGPGGQKMVILSDVGSSFDIVNVDLTLSDAAAAQLPNAQIVAGSFKPTNIDTTTDVFPAPAPAAPYENPAPAGVATFASAFGTDGTTMNGTWSLYVRDDVGADTGSLSGGWGIFLASPDYVCQNDVATVKSRADFDGDGRTDLSVFRPSEGNWYLQQSTAGFGVINWGIATDTLVPGNFDGDLKADTAIFRPNADSSQPDFYILNSNGFTVSGVSWGVAGDIPLSGDYDGDGKTDVAVYRPSTQFWYILHSAGGPITAVNFGASGDIPLVINHDGDARDNLATFRPGNNTWYIARATGVPSQNFDAVAFGQAGDLLAPADFVGDSRDDIAVFRPSQGTWYIRDSNGGATSTVNWGASGDIPVPGDYDGDGKDDTAIYRNGQWWVNRSTAGTLVANFGLGTDKAIPKAYIP